MVLKLVVILSIALFAGAVAVFQHGIQFDGFPLFLPVTFLPGPNAALGKTLQMPLFGGFISRLIGFFFSILILSSIFL